MDTSGFENEFYSWNQITWIDSGSGHIGRSGALGSSCSNGKSVPGLQDQLTTGNARGALPGLLTRKTDREDVLLGGGRGLHVSGLVGVHFTINVRIVQHGDVV